MNDWSWGVLPNTLKYIFTHIETVTKQEPKRKFWVILSFYQIYLDYIQDLLNPENFNLQIREIEKDVYLENLVTVEIKNTDQAFNLLNAGSNFWEIA